MTKDAVEKFVEDIQKLVSKADGEMRKMKTEKGVRSTHARYQKALRQMHDTILTFDDSKMYGDDWPMGGRKYAVRAWNDAEKHMRELRAVYLRYCHHAHLAKMLPI